LHHKPKKNQIFSCRKRIAYACMCHMADDATSSSAHNTPESCSDEVVVTLRIPPELNEKAKDAAGATGLKRADVMRLALDRGIDRLLEQLEAKPKDPAQA
jgi:hypothetical protein